MRILPNIFRRAMPAAIAATSLFAAGCLAPVHTDRSIWFLGRKAVHPFASHPKYEAYAKLSSLSVRQPFDSAKIAVLRDDGTIAFDAYNTFAALPSSMLKSAAIDALNNAALFKGVYRAGSSVKAQYEIEIEVLRFALDCTGPRRAVVEISAVLVSDRTSQRISLGKSSKDASDGNYSVAFTEAFFAAMEDAVSGL